MPLDAVVLSAVRKEITPVLAGSRIDKITMPEKDLLILSVHSREGNRKLLISLRPGSARVHFTEQSFENPPQPPMFCMLLRKHLLGARITGLDQPEGERLLRFHMDAVDELDTHSGKTLAVELMGKALNLVLAGDDGRVIDCMRRVDYESGAKRAMLPGLYYELPPAQDRPSFFQTETGALQNYIAAAPKERDPDDWLKSTFVGLSPLLCRELARFGWEKLPEEAEKICRRVREENYTPCMLLENGSPKDYSFLPIQQYGSAVENREFPDFSSLMDAFYSTRDREESLRRRSAELTRTARTAHERLLRKLAARRQELKATEDREMYRRRGDLITANIYRLSRGMRSFETEDYYEEGAPRVIIPLDGQKTPQQNAAACYRTYTKAKTASEKLTELIASAEEECAYLESVMDELSRASSDRDLGDIRREMTAAGYLREKNPSGKKKSLPPRKPLCYVLDSGHRVLVGRGNTENDELTFHTARRTDLWFHVQKYPGSHVILSQEEGKAGEEDIRTAAVIAVTHSGAADAGRCAVDWTMVRNVKKPSGSKPGRVIFTDYQTMIVSADKELCDRLKKEK